jgi:hypothetical protein
MAATRELVEAMTDNDNPLKAALLGVGDEDVAQLRYDRLR